MPVSTSSFTPARTARAASSRISAASRERDGPRSDGMMQ